MNDVPMDLFPRACGVAGPLQLHLTGPAGSEGVHLSLAQPFALIGSSDRTDVCLDHPEVSRRHAYLQAIAGRVLCVDLHSRTGLLLAGRKVRLCWLDSGQTIHIGPYRIRVELTPAADAPNAAERPAEWNPLAAELNGHNSLPEFSLEFLNGQTPQSLWPMKFTLALVGRLPGCQVRLVEPSVSRYHGALLRTPLGVWVIDLRGRDGVRVNGSPVRLARLQDGDEVQVGRFMIRARCPAPAPTPAPEGPPVPAADGQEPAANGPPEPAGTPGPGPSFGIVPLAGARAADHAELAEAFLVPIINQFNQMQQQMFDQFHQSVRMMVQMFSALHRDQMGLIREELDRLNQLTQELHGLQAELARQSSQPAEEAPAGPAPRPVASLDDTAAELLERVKALLSAPPAPAVAAEQTPTAEPIPAIPEPAQTAERMSAMPESALTVPPSPEEPEPPVPQAPPVVPPPAAAVDPSAPVPQTNDDVHLWLYQRIATIQRERESAWQRILNFMLGK